MKQWFFNNIPDFKAEVGFETQFNISNEGRNFLHKWKVTEVIPEKSIAYNWKFEEYSGEFVTTFELLKQDETTLLKLTARVLEDFPDNIPEFTRESGVEGWKYFIQGSLKDLLEK